jgi:hypothetical protein
MGRERQDLLLHSLERLDHVDFVLLEVSVDSRTGGVSCLFRAQDPQRVLE